MVPFFQSCNCFGYNKTKNSSATGESTSRSVSSSTGQRTTQDATDASISSVIRSKAQIFTLKDLSAATRDFSIDNRLGEGGFGVVYKGILRDGRDIAVKKLSSRSGQGKREFLNEVRLLATVQHRNLIKLYGCCFEESERLLVYEYLSNRSLDKHLFDLEAGSKLNWDTRHRIIVGMAKGLRYLHEDSGLRMVHRDIKPGNILLDDSFNPKIADFGLARLFSEEQTHVSTRLAGTLGYLAPEYALQGKLTEKADIFSFGIVVLEIINGRKNADRSSKRNQDLLLAEAWRLFSEHRLSELLDPRLSFSLSSSSSCGDGGSSGSSSQLAEEVGRVGHVALLCTQAEANLRPSTSKVVQLLTGKSTIQQSPTMPAYVDRGAYTSEESRSSSSGLATAALSSATSGSTRGSLHHHHHHHHQQERLFPLGSLDESLPYSSILTMSATFGSTDHTQVDPR